MNLEISGRAWTEPSDLPKPVRDHSAQDIYHSGKDERIITDSLGKTLLAEIDMKFLDLLEVMDRLHAL